MNTKSKRAKSIKLTGDYTIYEVNELKQKIMDCFEKSDKVNIRLSEIERVDACIIQLLISALKEAKAREIKLQILDVPELVNEFMKRIHCEEILEEMV